MSYPAHLIDALARVYVEAVVDQLISELQNETRPDAANVEPCISTTKANTTNAQARSARIETQAQR